jgi:hypothetical protein
MRKSSPSTGDLRADATPLPFVPNVATRGGDSRLVDAWCEFLVRLATDAEAALAAAMAYRELDGPGRDVWITALETDVARIAVPRIAVYAPLLAVETDAKRRARVVAALGPVQPDATARGPAFALTSRPGSRPRVAAVVAPLYLDFVQVLACAYRSGEGFDWVKHDPIVERSRAPRSGDTVGGAVLEATPLNAAVDDLAITVVAHTRSGLALPEALSVFADLFGPGGEAPTRLAVAG